MPNSSLRTATEVTLGKLMENTGLTNSVQSFFLSINTKLGIKGNRVVFAG